MMRKYSHLLIVAAILLTGCQTNSPVPTTSEHETPVSTTEPTPTPEVGTRVGIFAGAKKPAPKYVTIDHGFLKIQFDESRRLPLAVKYVQTASQLKKRYIKRKTDVFTQDRCLLKHNPKLAIAEDDFEDRTNFNIGHMAPAEDFSWDEDAYSVVFHNSNMTPQKASFNQGTWRYLESDVIDLACGEERITVISGPVFTATMTTAPNGLIRPNRFYKVVVDETKPRKLVAFLYDDTATDKDPNLHIVPLVQIEKETGLTFKEEIADLEALNPSKKGSLKGWASKSCPQLPNQVLDKDVRKARNAREKAAKKLLKNKKEIVQLNKVEPPCWKGTPGINFSQ